MKHLKSFIVLSFVLWLLAACESASDTVVSVPNVSVSCDSSSNASCNASVNGNNAFVIMTRSGCGDSAAFEPVAQGNTSLSCDSSGCSGTVSTWNDQNSNAVNEIISGRMDVCSYIDIDNNSSEGSGDLVNETSANIQSSDEISIDTWGDFSS